MSTLFSFTSIVRSFFIVVLVSFQFISLSAQCLVENLVYDGNTFDNRVGQSFKALAADSLKSVSVLSPENVSDLKMVIYEGDGLDGPPLLTLSNISLHAMANEKDFSTIDVSASNISLGKGEMYTFYFLSDVSLGGSAKDEYKNGIMYLMDVDMEPFELTFKVNSHSVKSEITHMASVCINK